MGKPARIKQAIEKLDAEIAALTLARTKLIELDAVTPQRASRAKKPKAAGGLPLTEKAGD